MPNYLPTDASQGGEVNTQPLVAQQNQNTASNIPSWKRFLFTGLSAGLDGLINDPSAPFTEQVPTSTQGNPQARPPLFDVGVQYDIPYVPIAVVVGMLIIGGLLLSRIK